MRYPQIDNDNNPYRDAVIGKSNEPITVAGLLDRSRSIAASREPVDWPLEHIYDRLEHNAPRIAIIGGSADHPAHIMDYQTVAYAALRIWRNGGVPFYFATPVMCDGTAQDNQGMSYSLESRNAVARIVVNQLEAHSYHGAFVIQGCDKQPLGVVSALAHVDRLRRYRGEAPFFATFAPAHVLSGGAYPEDLAAELRAVAAQAEAAGAADIAEDVRDCLDYVLVCSTNTSFQGVLGRAAALGVISRETHKRLEKRLAVSTCDAKGGVCAFNGTGNSSRHVVAALGLVHPELELLTAPPTREQVDIALDSLAAAINKPQYGVSHLLAANIRNAIRIHSASGGSTNLLMHIVACMLYGGFKFSVWEYDRLHHEHPIPDLFDYSLTAGRDIFTLARQCCAGDSRGMESLFYELLRNGVPMDVHAPTVAGATWAQRLARAEERLPASRVRENPVILSAPRRPYSGVDVLTGNFFDSAVVKVSGMSSAQLDDFDRKLNVVVYFDNEQEANRRLLAANFAERLQEDGGFDRDTLLTVLRHNSPGEYEQWRGLPYDELFRRMIAEGALKLAIVIAGQGPAAFGMPEMYTPMQHINANRQIRKLATVISDGRYSGVTLGAAVGHMTPEAWSGGGILYVQTGDVLYLGLRERTISLVDRAALLGGELCFADMGRVRAQREQTAGRRLDAMKRRRRLVAGANRLDGHTDAAHGVVPLAVFEEAELDYAREADSIYKREENGEGGVRDE